MSEPSSNNPEPTPEKKGSSPESEQPAPLAIKPRSLGMKREGDMPEEKTPRLLPSGRTFQPRTRAKGSETKEEEPEEAPEEVAETVEGEEVPREFDQSPRRARPSVLKPLMRTKLPLIPALILGVTLIVVVGLWSFDSGREEGLKEAEALARKPADELLPEVRAKLDAATFNLRNGQREKALEALRELESTTTYPSLSYLVALAALENGDIDLAAQKAQASIDKRQKVSDAYSLLAVVESQRSSDQSRVKMGSTMKRAQSLLNQAIAADPANPYPRFELATLLRYERRKEEAAKEVKSALTLLNPVDSHFIMEITDRIMTLESTPVDQLPKTSGVSDNPQKLIPDAYAAMRLGDFARAAALLQTAKSVMSVESFDYLVNDPALRRFAQEPALAQFYQ